jgi:hypothetical protein
MQHQPITLRETAARLKTVLRVVADTTPRGARADRALIMLAYASIGLHFPGTPPTGTVQLARCIALLNQFPWMREKAFAVLSALPGSAWPHIIRQWDELEAELEQETGCSPKPEDHAPRTYRMLHGIIIQRCDNPRCSHPKDAHDGKDFTGRCAIPGCVCGFFRPPHYAGVGPAAESVVAVVKDAGESGEVAILDASLGQ